MHEENMPNANQKYNAISMTLEELFLAMVLRLGCSRMNNKMDCLNERAPINIYYDKKITSHITQKVVG